MAVQGRLLHGDIDTSGTVAYTIGMLNLALNGAPCFNLCHHKGYRGYGSENNSHACVYHSVGGLPIKLRIMLLSLQPDKICDPLWSSSFLKLEDLKTDLVRRALALLLPSVNCSTL